MALPSQINRASADQGRLALRSELAESRRRYALANPLSLAAHHHATHYMPGGNTRSVLHVDPFPLFFERGHGSTLTDLDGHQYDDFLCEFTAGIYGHSNPTILGTLETTTRQGLGLGGHSRHEAKLAELLVNRFPAIELVRFCNSGTEANLMALGAARVATGRDKVLVFSGAYHGGVLAFSRPGPINAPFDMVVASYNDVAETRSKLRLHAPQLAAVIVEPMLQSGGCIPASAEFLHMLRAETIGVGALLIFDEVVTSRLHPGGIHGALGLRPDLVTLGKYIGGGLSFGAFGGSRQVMNLFDPRLPDGVPHAGTFNNNTLSMAVAFAGLSELYTPDAAIALNARGEQLRAKLNALAKAGCVRLQFTGIGSIIAAHPTTKKLLSAEDAAEGELALRELLFFHLLERGVYIAKRGMISLALTTSEAQIRHLEESVAQFIEAYRHLLKDPDQN